MKLRVRPSELLDIRDAYRAYCFDEAVVLWGNTVETAVEEAAEKAKTASERKQLSTRELKRWLNPGEIRGQYAAPKATKVVRSG